MSECELRSGVGQVVEKNDDLDNSRNEPQFQDVVLYADRTDCRELALCFLPRAGPHQWLNSLVKGLRIQMFGRSRSPFSIQPVDFGCIRGQPLRSTGLFLYVAFGLCIIIAISHLGFRQKRFLPLKSIRSLNRPSIGSAFSSPRFSIANSLSQQRNLQTLVRSRRP